MIKITKKSVTLFAVVMSCVLLSAWVQADRVRHPFYEIKKKKAFDNKVEEIPLYAVGEKIDRDYIELKPIVLQDIFSQNRSGAYLKMRRQAFKVNADAIIEVECQSYAKMVALRCSGYAIKWK